MLDYFGMRDDDGVRRNPECDPDYLENFFNFRLQETQGLWGTIKKHGDTMHIKNLRNYLRWIEDDFMDQEDLTLLHTLRRAYDHKKSKPNA